MLELLMTGFIRKIKGVHLSVIKDIEITFFRVKVYLGLENNFI